ncbi:glycosyltransferase, family 11 [Cooperia oncophora]
MAVLMTLSIVPPEAFLQLKPRADVIKKSRLFPQGVVRYVVLTSFVVFLLGMAVLMTLSIVPPEAFLQLKPRADVIKKSRLFPQGGEDVKFDQPWVLPKPKVISDITFFDWSTGNYIVSNFSYSKGIGNLMFQYASLRSLAEKWNSTLVVPVTTTLRRAFVLNTTFVSKKVADELLERAANNTIDIKSCCEFVSIQKPTNQRFTAVTGYLQNPRYFAPHDEALIRKEFDFLPAIQEQALTFMQTLAARRALEQARPLYVDGKPSETSFEMETDALTDDMYYIGVHVRRGMDIAMNSRNLRHGHVAAPPDYYKRAMEIASEGKDNVVFVVCSDNPIWAKKHLPKYEKGMIFACPGLHREIDMAILSHCDALVLSTGTFSWWSGFLNAKSEKVKNYFITE